MPTGNFYFSLGADSTTFLLTFYKIYFVNVRKSGDSGSVGQNVSLEIKRLWSIPTRR